MTLVFDYDGTIHNTAHIYGMAFRRAYDWLVQSGFAPRREYTDEEVSKWLGFAAPKMWSLFMPQLPEEVWKQASAMIGEEMIWQVEAGCAQLFGGAAGVLGHFHELEIPMVILSNCRTAYMDAHRKMLGLDVWFDGYFCGETYGFMPKREIVPFIRERFPDDQYVFIGDRADDIEAGIAHGYPAIACAYGYGTQEEQRKATVVINDIRKLPDAIEIYG